MIPSLLGPCFENLTGRLGTLAPFGSRDPALVQPFFGQIESSPGRIERYVLAKVRYLQTCADRIGPSESLGGVGPSKSKDDSPDGVGRSPAVVEKLRVIFVARDRLVLDERREQIVERIDAQRESFDRLMQRDEDRVERVALGSFMQFAAPPLEEFHRPNGICDFIGKIVGPSAIGIDGGKMGSQIAREPQVGHREVLVVVFC